MVAVDNVRNCYQCGKCTAGCPRSGRMDVAPNRLLRFVQLGFVDQAAKADAIWQCVSCQTCSARCPQEVDCAGVIDHLRERAMQNPDPAVARNRTVIFYKTFLDNVRRNGRLNEMELAGVFKLRSFTARPDLAFLFSGAGLAPRLHEKGKFHLLGEKVEDRGVVQRIFERCG